MKFAFIGLLSCFLVNAYSQKTNIARPEGFQFNAQAFALVVGNIDEIDITPDELLMHVRDSRLIGINFEASYRFDEFWILGLGTGYEYINQPDISYVPLYISLRSSIGGDKIEAPIFRLNVGTQFGDLAKIAPLLRAGIGYRLPIYKELCLNLEGIITYQGLRKEFESNPGIIQYYNMYGFGIGAGLEL
ncbi:MAG: hypothetical protein GX159_10795 [Flavobacteriaceae bacterium]|nr:hypothetical protein [Flavobacteriaceae bacterium]